MKKLVLVLLYSLLTSLPAFSQAPPPTPQGKTYIATQYGSWLLYTYQGNIVTGNTSIYVNPYNSQGPNIPPFVLGLPLSINRGASDAETVTITGVQICNSGVNNCVNSQVCNPGSQLCQVNGNFTYAHPRLDTIQSATYGLQEAINAAMSTSIGGTVLLDESWQGTTSMITNTAKGSIAVVVQDNRSGAPQNYQWNGTNYAYQGGGAGTTPLATYGSQGSVAGGIGYVSAGMVTGGTDVAQAINSVIGTLPNGSMLDATGLGTNSYTYTHQINLSGKTIHMVLSAGTTFVFNGNLGSSRSPSNCAVTVGNGSSITVPGSSSLNGNFQLGSSAVVWGQICNGDFTGNQESLTIDGVHAQGNSTATVGGAQFFVAGIFTPSIISNSSTITCFATCFEMDAGTTGSGGSAISDVMLFNDVWQDSYTGTATYPGCVVVMNSLNSQGEVANINFFGGMIQLNGPHNPLLCINGNGGVQTDSIGFFGTTFQGAAASPGGTVTDVNPIQITDGSSVYISNLRFAGTNNNTYQTHLVEILSTVANAQYGINLNQIVATTGNFQCLVYNQPEGSTCSAGFPQGAGDTGLPNYTYGQIFPTLRLENYAPPSSACTYGTLGTVWSNSTASSPLSVCALVSGTPTWTTPGAGTAAAAGATCNVQFNSSGALSGDSTLCFNSTTKELFGRSIAGRIYTDQLTGSTLDVRLNLCNTWATAHNNGAVAYVCDASNEVGAQTIAAPVTLGNSAGLTVGLVVPCNAVWTVTISDGVSSGINQYGGTSIMSPDCPAGGISNNMNIAAGAGANMKYVFTTITSTQPYVVDSGFTVKNTSGTPTVSGVAFFWQGPLNDGTNLNDVNVYDTADTYNVKAYNISSGSTWQNSSFNAGNHGTPFFMYTDNSGYVTAVSLHNDTIVHPGTGNPAFYCLDVRTNVYGKISTAVLDKIYTETNPDGVTASYQASGCGKISMSHVTVKCYATTGNCTAPGATVSNAYNTAFLIDDMRFMHGQNNYTYPATVIINNYDGTTTYTDSIGNFDHYAPKSVPSSFGPITVASCTGCGGGGGGGGTIVSGPQYQLPAFNTAPTGTSLGPSSHLWALTGNESLTQVNALLASLSSSDTVILPAGFPQMAYSNPNGANFIDNRLSSSWAQMAIGGIACDAKETVMTISGGSTTYTDGNISAADVGKTYNVGIGPQTLGYGTGAPQYAWFPTIVSVSYPTVTLSSAAPATISQRVDYGTDNTANLQTLMNSMGYAHPILVPAGCSILITSHLAWNNAQSFIGQSMATSVIIGAPGDDVLQEPDGSGLGSVSVPGVQLRDIAIEPNLQVDASRGYTKVAANGTTTTVPPLNRPLYTFPAQISNNPTADGWGSASVIGVANITASSTQMCVPSGESITLTAGNTVAFPYLTGGVFSTTISTTTGSCGTGYASYTLAAASPSTVTQSYFISSSSLQTTTTAIITNPTPSAPVTITLSRSIAPSKIGGEANVAPMGRVKIGANEFDYFGESTTNNTITLVRGPATGFVSTSSGAVVIPINPCPATYEVPWPVQPTINTGDSTPSGANYFPGACMGNAAIAMPQANGNVFVGTGFSKAHLYNVNMTGTPNVSPFQGGNNSGCMYFAGNNAPYDSGFDSFMCVSETYGVEGAPASYGMHGVKAVGPTAAGNHFSNYTIRTAYNMGFVDLQQSEIGQGDMYSTLINPYDGTVVGSVVGVYLSFAQDEQTGLNVTNTSIDSLHDGNSEPEGGTRAIVPVSAQIDCYLCKMNNWDFEGGFNYFGGSKNSIIGGQLSNPVVNWGAQNYFSGSDLTQYGYMSDTWGLSTFYNWGVLSNCEIYQENGGGPLGSCAPGLAQSYNGTTAEAALSLNWAHPYDNVLSGDIKPGEWSTSGVLDAGPMASANNLDATEPFWGRYAACNIGSGINCQPNHFGNTFNGGIWIGPHNRIVDAPSYIIADFKTVNAASSFNLVINAFDAGDGVHHCASPGQLLSSAVTTSTSWQTVMRTVDFTGKDQCTLSIQMGNSTTSDTLEVGRFLIFPAPLGVLGPSVAPTEGATCPADAWLGAFSGYTYYCDGATNTVKRVAIT